MIALFLTCYCGGGGVSRLAHIAEIANKLDIDHEKSFWCYVFDLFHDHVKKWLKRPHHEMITQKFWDEENCLHMTR